MGAMFRNPCMDGRNGNSNIEKRRGNAAVGLWNVSGVIVGM